MIGKRLYDALSAAEALAVVNRSHRRLNARGKRVLDYLRSRRRRAEQKQTQPV